MPSKAKKTKTATQSTNAASESNEEKQKLREKLKEKLKSFKGGRETNSVKDQKQTRQQQATDAAARAKGGVVGVTSKAAQRDFLQQQADIRKSLAESGVDFNAMKTASSALTKTFSAEERAKYVQNFTANGETVQDLISQTFKTDDSPLSEEAKNAKRLLAELFKDPTKTVQGPTKEELDLAREQGLAIMEQPSDTF